MDCVWLADVAVSSPSVAGAERSGICLLLCLCYCQTSLLLFAVIPESCSRKFVFAVVVSLQLSKMTATTNYPIGRS